jgi:hypothetical protein
MVRCDYQARWRTGTAAINNSIGSRYTGDQGRALNKAAKQCRRGLAVATTPQNGLAIPTAPQSSLAVPARCEAALAIAAAPEGSLAVAAAAKGDLAVPTRRHGGLAAPTRPKQDVHRCGHGTHNPTHSAGLLHHHVFITCPHSPLQLPQLASSPQPPRPQMSSGWGPNSASDQANAITMRPRAVAIRHQFQYSAALPLK